MTNHRFQGRTADIKIESSQGTPSSPARKEEDDRDRNESAVTNSDEAIEGRQNGRRTRKNQLRSQATPRTRVHSKDVFAIVK